MQTLLLLTALLGVPFGQNMLYNNSGILAAGSCLSFQNGTWAQICSPADGIIEVKTAAGGVGSIRNLNDIYQTAMISDAAPTPVPTWTGKPPMNSTTSTHTEGGSIVLAPASGLQRLTGVTRAGTAGDTLTFTYQDMEGASASVVLTEGAGVGQWSCAGAADDATCVCNIYTLVTGHATLGSRVTVTRTDGTCSDAKLSFGVVPGTTSTLYVLPSDNTNEPVTHGTGGKIYADSFTTNTNAFSFTGGNLNVVGNSVSASNIIANGENFNTLGLLTPGTMAFYNGSYGYIRSYASRVSFTNAMIVALGAVGSGDISVATLPAKTVVRNIYLVVDTQCTFAAGTLTMAIGRTGATYLDYIAPSNIKATANTVYGAVLGDRGANLTGYDLPSYTGTTTIYAHVIAGAGTLNGVTTCTGHVDIETELVL